MHTENVDEEANVKSDGEDLFDSFFKKWAIPEINIYTASAKVSGVVRIESSKSVEEVGIKRKRRTREATEFSGSAKAKLKKAKVPKIEIPAADELPQVFDLPQNILGRQPTNKVEALMEITMYMSDQLSAEIKLNSQNAGFLIMAPYEEDEPNAIYWKRNSARMGSNATEAIKTPFLCLIYEIEQIASQLATDLDGFFDQIHLDKSVEYSRIYVVILGLKTYISKLSTQANRQFREAVLAGTRLPTVTRSTISQIPMNWSELENKAWLAALRNKMNLVMLNSYAEFRDFLQHTTKCVAFEPYSHSSSQFNFCVQGINRRSGSTFSETMQLMLSEVQRITPAIASSLARNFGTVRNLMETLSAQGERSLENVQTGNKSLGQMASSRLYQFFTSQNPNKPMK
jgi:hypothetical protein